MSDAGGFSVPPFPLAARIGLRAWGAAARVGLGRPDFDEARLIATARRNTGLHDFVDPSFRVPLRKMLHAFEEEADLHVLGRSVLRTATVRALEARLRLEHLCDLHPEIEARPVERPIFVTGLQRTGTTKLHRLLAAAPELRALSAVEGLRLAPMGRPVRDDPADFARRARDAKLAERGMRYLSPALFAIHPIEADAPEEDIFLFDATFVSPAVDASLAVPSYTRWIREVDQRPIHAYVRRLIQLLLWQRPGRYLGKTPHYQENLDVLLEVFPDVKVVHTHRDPARVVPSFASMMAHAGALLSRRDDPRAVGRRVVDQMSHAVERAIAARDAVPDGRVLDVHYLDLVRDPVATLRRVHAFLELDWTPESEARVRGWLGGNPQHKYGVHRYALADFGLEASEIEERFKGYRERFGVEAEPA